MTMRPATVHALAQAIRHTRGLLATLEKWIAATPPELLARELATAIGELRSDLVALNSALAQTTAPRPTTVRKHNDRPAALAARSDGPTGP